MTGALVEYVRASRNEAEMLPEREHSIVWSVLLRLAEELDRGPNRASPEYVATLRRLGADPAVVDAAEGRGPRARRAVGDWLSGGEGDPS